MQYTSIEQSRKLIELGLNPETADAWWYRSTFGVIDGWNIKWDEESTEELTLCRMNPSNEVAIVKREETPAWSLGALMNILPPYISKHDGQVRKSYGINLFRSYYHCCGYSFGPSLKEENHDNLCCFGCDSWIDAVFETIVWCYENGYMSK